MHTFYNQKVSTITGIVILLVFFSGAVFLITSEYQKLMDTEKSQIESLK